MLEYKISCPHCGLHIAVTEHHAGTRIPCPTCQKEMKVPAPATPAARQAASPVAAGPHAASKPGPPVPPPQRLRVGDSDEKKQKKKAILITAGVVLGLGLALAVLWPTIRSWQSGMDKARDESGPGMVGEQMGHIAELNSVLDATDPAKMYKGLASSPPSRDEGVGRDPVATKLAKLSPATAMWAADVPPGPLPEGRASGTLSGTNFLVESASMLMGAATPILTLRQGEGATPQGEVLIYLRMKRGEPVEGKTFRVSPTDPKPEARVIKRWQAGGTKQAAFAKGFALRLEFGKPSDGVLPGKLFLALPDREKSVVAGVFFAALSSVQPTGAPGAAPRMDADER